LIDSNQKFNPVVKDRLFYDQFKYCISFHLDEINCLRELDHDSIDEMVQRRQAWRQIAQQRWVNGKQSYKSNILGRRCKEITASTVSDLHALAEILLTASNKFKLVVSVDQGYVYTNDLCLIDQLDAMPQLTHKNYTQAQIDRPRNTIQLKHSQHKYRSYFRLIKLTADEKTQLVKFLKNHQNSVRLSPALTQWLPISFNRTQDYFFVDYDTTLWLTMLALVHPGLIRKTMQIIQAK
jgi:hypothetical protein